MDNRLIIIFIFLLSNIFSYIVCTKAIEEIIKITKKVNLSFYSDQRRSASKNKSRLGGAGILISQMSLFFIGIFILNNIFNYGLTIPFVLIFTVLLFFIIGIFDDLFSVNPFFRLIFQFLIFIAWNFGMRLEFINLTIQRFLIHTLLNYLYLASSSLLHG